MKGFRGCGSIWMPSQPGVHSLDANVWMPVSEGLASLRETLLPVYPDLKAIRELSISPYLRSQFACEDAGTVRLTVSTLSQGFEEVGVAFSEPVKCIA